jgi:hypothetical protein
MVTILRRLLRRCLLNLDTFLCVKKIHMSQRASVEQIRAQQDATLSLIEEGVGNLHEASRAIAGELHTQHVLLDNLTENVDRTREGIRTQTGQVATLRNKPSTWKLWLCVILGLVFLAFLILSYTRCAWALYML